MACRLDAGKHAEWGKRLGRFSSSGLTVARFCARERVSVASFYHWRKKLGPPAPRRRAVGDVGLFQAVTVVPTAADVSIQLPGGTQIEVRAEHLAAVQAVIAEVARVDRGFEEVRPPHGPEPAGRA